MLVQLKRTRYGPSEYSSVRSRSNIQFYSGELVGNVTIISYKLNLRRVGLGRRFEHAQGGPTRSRWSTRTRSLFPATQSTPKAFANSSQPSTPKAFANSSPGLERSDNPGITIKNTNKP